MYKAIKNIDNHDFKIPFNFFTYSIPKEKTVLVEEDLFNFIKDSWPKSFNFEIEGVKYPTVEKVQTRAYIRTQEGQPTPSMAVSSPTPTPTFRGADLTPPNGTVDSDGVGWYGDGIQIEGGANVG